jgi:hypothetical protein
MKILSFDVGIKNLSYCVMEKNEETNHIQIHHWGIINLTDDETQKTTMNYTLFENIPKKFDEKPELLDGIQQVLIENQPTLKNPTMKSIQMIIYSYFLIRGKIDKKDELLQNIRFISATNKLKVYQGPYIDPDLYTKTGNLKKNNKKNQPVILDYFKEENQTQENPPQQQEEEKIEIKKGSAICYGDKKKLSILYTREMIRESHPEFLSYFESNNKKDDLADSFLQGMYVLTLENKKVQTKTTENKPKTKRNTTKKTTTTNETTKKTVKRKETVKKEEIKIVEEKPKSKRGRKKKIVEEKKEDMIDERAYLGDSSEDEK